MTIGGCNGFIQVSSIQGPINRSDLPNQEGGEAWKGELAHWSEWQRNYTGLLDEPSSGYYVEKKTRKDM